MPFCSQCGKPVRENDKFCQSCGNSVLPPPAAGQPEIEPKASPAANPVVQNVSAPSDSETAIAIVPDLMKRQGLGKDSFYLIVTARRSLFVKITAPLAQKASRYNLEKNPNQTKSIWSRWKAQVAGPNIYLQYFNSLSPDQALRESDENFIIDNAQISRVKCVFTYREEDPSEWQVEFQSAAGNHKFVSLSNPESLLKTAYQTKFSK